MYKVANILTNCHTCMYGSQVSQHFGLDPPSLLEYLRPHHCSPWACICSDVYNNYAHLCTVSAICLFTSEICWLPIYKRLPYFPVYKTTLAYQMRRGVGLQEYHLLPTFMKNILCLPHSSTAIECVFSQVNLFKTNCQRTHCAACCTEKEPWSIVPITATRLLHLIWRGWTQKCMMIKNWIYIVCAYVPYIYIYIVGKKTGAPFGCTTIFVGRPMMIVRWW